MYTRKIYEPENKLRLQIPGHGIGSAAGTAAQQEVWGKVTQPRSPQAQAAATGAAQGGRRYTTKMGLPSLYVPEENTWLSRGAFRDGYQFGDVTRGITGTMLETSENVLTGALRVAENAIDAMAGRAANFKPLEKPLTEFVTRDLIDEEKWARRINRYGNLSSLAGMAFGVDTDRDSFLGDKAEPIAQSAGQLTLAVGLNSVGVPGELVSAISSYGSEMERALQAGATPRQANVSATISALGEVITEKASGAIKFGGKALDDALVGHLTDGISNRFWKTLVKAGLGGVGEGNEEIVSEMISRFGQWLTYQNDETLREMLFSGEAREAYLDSFLGGYILGAPAGAAKALLPERDLTSPKKAQGEPSQDQTVDPNTDVVLAQPQVTAQAETGKPTTSSRPGEGPRRILLTEPDTAEDLNAETDKTSAPAKDTPDLTQREDARVPYYTADIWTNDLDGLWTEGDADSDIDSGTDSSETPVRYEDYLRRYLEGDSELSVGPDAVVNTAPDGESAPKTTEQTITELAPKIAKPGITPDRAVIAAQEMYSEAEKIFGADTDIVLEMFESGQEPRKFLDGIINAYLAGKMGNSAALENSTAAAYLTAEQRNYAFELGKSVDDYRMDIKEERQEQGLAELNWPPRGAPITREAYKEIMRYARDRKIELAGFKHYDGDIDAIKKMVDDVKRISECFPGLADERRRLTIELGRTLDDDTFAQTHGRIIKINMNAYRNSQKLETEYQKLVEEGWFVKGTNSRAIVAHEMGHVVEMVFGIDALSLVHEATGLKRDEVVDFCQENLSFYSAAYSDGSEIISECFASVFGSSENNEFALNIVERCANIVARKGVTLD